MQYRRVALVAVLFLTIAFAKKKKNPDDITQTLDLPKDPPMVASGESRHLVFQVSPLSAKGLLSQQTREALKSIGYKGDVVIESFTTDVKVIARAAAIWRRIEPTRNEIAVNGLKFLKKTLR